MHIMSWNNIPVGVKEMLEHLTDHLVKVEVSIVQRKGVNNERFMKLYANADKQK